MLKLSDQWVWDSWFAFDGKNHHVFYLQASRGLIDPELRHNNSSIGHAVSADLKSWTVVQDAIIPSQAPAADDFTTWTGSVIRDENGLWWMFYTGRSKANNGARQTIAAATSVDLLTWKKLEQNPILIADNSYQTLSAGFQSEPFRDPWVFKLPGESDWTMLITASARESLDARQKAVLAVAKSKNLIDWQLLPPQAGPDEGFGETEVFQFEVVDGVPVLIFCCSTQWLSDERLGRGERGGVYSIPLSSGLDRISFSNAQLFPNPNIYAARLVKGNDGQWNLIAFINEVDGKFIGELCDPIPVTADPVKGLISK